MAANQAAQNLLALDAGHKRIGVATASAEARLPRPLVTLHNDGSLWEALRRICTDEQVGTVVIGLPRGLDGQETAQTAFCRQFAKRTEAALQLPVVLQDEALTSRQAEAELDASGKKNYDKAAVDALAATYILEDYLKQA